jgi:ubiquinone/menaquinone biosynthesis C-methylase UbiE
MLTERASLTGVDVSREQLPRAAQQLPNATLIHGDATEIEFESASFDAIVAFYVLNHVPQDRLGPLLADAARWLRPEGLFLATFPTTDNPGWQGDFLGTQMFFAGFAPETNRALVERAGLVVLRDELETTVEPEYGEARWQWLLARKP